MKEKKLSNKNPENEKKHTLVSFTLPAESEEIERYWIDQPYVFVSILKNINSKDIQYHIVEPHLEDKEQSLLDEVKTIIGDVLSLKDNPNLDEITDSYKNELIKKKIKELLKDHKGLDDSSFEKIYYYIKRDFVGFGKISPLMLDPYIEDTWCNGKDIPIYVYHSSYGNLDTNIIFDNDEDTDAFVMRVAHQSSRHISKSSPILDTVMNEGSRINITYGYEISPKGSSFSIRKQKKVPLTPLDLIEWNTFSSDMMAYFWLCMANGKNILFCGGTASGKTSSLNAICMFIPMNIRVVTLEDTREIQLPHENWIPTVTRDGIASTETGKIDLEDLLKASLRQRPDYLLVGEVRGRESNILFQAMNAGHATCSTFHAGSPIEVINRFTNPPIDVPKAMFTALDIISMQSNVVEDGTEKRRASKIAEITGVSEGISIKDVYEWNILNDEFEYKGSKVLEDIKERRGWSEEELKADIGKRKRFLEMMITKDIRDYDKIVEWLDKFNRSQEKAIAELDSFVQNQI